MHMLASLPDHPVPETGWPGNDPIHVYLHALVVDGQPCMHPGLQPSAL